MVNLFQRLSSHGWTVLLTWLTDDPKPEVAFRVDDKRKLQVGQSGLTCFDLVIDWTNNDSNGSKLIDDLQAYYIAFQAGEPFVIADLNLIARLLTLIFFVLDVLLPIFIVSALFILNAIVFVVIIRYRKQQRQECLDRELADL